MGKFLKKNWFIALIALIFIGISVYYIYDTNKGKLKGKTVNGEDVAYSVNNEDITASMFYDDMYKTSGEDTILNLIMQSVISQSVETTDEMKAQAEKQAKSIRESYQSQYGSSYLEELEADLKTTGYATVEDYLIEQFKLSKLNADYAKAHFDELQIRNISYILIQYEDQSNPSEEATDDEKARMKAVDDALNSGTDFAEAAKQFSEDTSTAPDGGVLGTVDNKVNSLDIAFLQAALALNEGEVSDWVHSEDFGYFRIKCNAATPETLEALDTSADPYSDLVNSYDTTLTTLAMWEKMQEMGYDFHGDAELEKNMLEAFGQGQEESEEEE